MGIRNYSGLDYIPSWLTGATTLLQKLNRCIDEIEKIKNSGAIPYSAGTGIKIESGVISGNYKSGKGISINGATISGDYKAGNGININNDIISIAENTITSLIENKIMDKVFPVGSIYIAYNNINPNEIIGGSWERIKGAFLYGAEDDIGENSDYIIGASGGSKNAVVVGHSHNSNFTFHYIPDEQAGESNTVLGEYTGASGRTVSVNTTTVGESGTDKNMPPYVCVNIWKRVL